METITEENINNKEDDENSEFYFESDHLALRNNKDYLSLLKTVVTLEALRIKSLEDLDTLISCRKKALNDPLSFAKQLQNGCHLELPGSRKIPDIPKIDFSQYTVYGSDTRMGPQTRPKETPSICEKKIDDNKRLVRGRIFDDSKPETFNQPWTDEEQMRLDRLLEKYPEETIQMRRWTKIANELGNRTPKQVSSRVQKYEIKLKQVAMTFRKGNKSETSAHSRLGKRKRRGNRASTFFPYKEFDSCENNDDDNMDIDKNNYDNSIDGVSSNPSGYCDDSNSSERSEGHTQRVYTHIEMLQRIKIEKNDDTNLSHGHFGFKCAGCKSEPIRGTRWHCAECHNVDIDFCSDCVITQIDSSTLHSINHKFIPYDKTKKTNNYDLEYFPSSFSGSSYLDSNYITG